MNIRGVDSRAHKGFARAGVDRNIGAADGSEEREGVDCYLGDGGIPVNGGDLVALVTAL